MRLLLNDGRANPSACDNQAIKAAYREYHLSVLDVLVTSSRIDIRVRARHNTFLAGMKILVFQIRTTIELIGQGLALGIRFYRESLQSV